MEKQLETSNAELKKMNNKIILADGKLEEAEYGVRRRRGTLISLQKMSDKRLQRFGFDKSKLIPIEKDEAGEYKEDENQENMSKQLTFDEMLQKSNNQKIEKNGNDEKQKRTEKAKLEFRRHIFMFKKKVRSVENHCLDTENKILVQKSKESQSNLD